MLAVVLASTNVIYLIGDSTCANYSEKSRPRFGWGEKLGNYISEYRIDNRATSGRSTKSFINEGRWDSVMETLKEGDYVFIQFGHNDEKLKDPKRGTEPFGEFYDNLCRFISDARSKGACPVLLTPVCRRKFDKEGNVVLTHKDYPAAMKKAGEDTGTLVLDMESKTADWLQEAGKSGSGRFFMYSVDGKDNTHFTEEGADAVAKMAAESFRKSTGAVHRAKKHIRNRRKNRITE